MTAQDIESKIRIRELPCKDGSILIDASLALGSCVLVSALARRYSDAVQSAREEAKERLMRSIYEDQRRALGDAIMQLRMCHPGDYDGIHKAHENIMKLARCQQPKPIEP